MSDIDLGLIREVRERELRRQARGPSRERGTDLAFAIAFAVVAVLLVAVDRDDPTPSVLTIVTFVGMYAFASSVEFEVGSGRAVPTQLVFVPMLCIFPAGWIPLVAAAGFVVANTVQALMRHHRPTPTLMLASSWYAVGPALVLLAHGPVDAWSDAPVVVLAVAAQLVADTVSTAAAEWAAYGRRPSPAALAANRWVYMIDVMLTPLGLLIVPAVAVHPWGLILAAPVIALLAFFARERTERLTGALELTQAYRGTALLLGDVLEVDDSYTAAHCEGVLELSLAVAVELGLDDAARREIEFTALLHDIGKLRIPNELINKPGPLTEDERRLMETHTVEGERMLAPIGGFLARIGALVRACHERWDGGGYPDGLAGPAIPLAARIVFCCDAYDAITTDRPYRGARTPAEACAEITACAGTQFDPAVAAALTSIVGGRLSAAPPRAA